MPDKDKSNGINTYIDSFEKILLESNTIEWIIDRSRIVSSIRYNYTTKLPLVCKACNTPAEHSPSNLRHCIKNPGHISCTFCRKKRLLANSRIIRDYEKLISESKTFEWYLDKDKIIQEFHYTHKTKLPLICKTCNTPAEHSPGNIRHTINNPGHIRCQVCQLRMTWAERVAEKSNGEYKLDTAKTDQGFKLIHNECGEYHYINNPHYFKKGYCPYCNKDKLAFQRLSDFNQVKKYVERQSNNSITLTDYNFNNNILTIYCNKHPELIYQIDRDAFLRSKANYGNYKCRECSNQDLRRTTYFNYNIKIKPFGLYLENNSNETKVNSKAKLTHKCLNKAYHPDLIATPYEVEFKNKRCPYCYTSISFHLDYQYMKKYIEMDEDRIITHCKTFELLSSEKEVKAQIIKGKHIAGVKIRIKEHQCKIHPYYEVTWGSFYHRQVGCTECALERNVSFAHTYLKLLLRFFNIPFTPEKRVNRKRLCRADFYLEDKDLYVEVDSILHSPEYISNGNRIKPNRFERDQFKNKTLEDKIFRIELYDQSTELPIQKQLNIIDEAFLTLYPSFSISDIYAARKNDSFHKFTRIDDYILKLNKQFGSHIKFHESSHLDLIKQIEDGVIEFHCSQHNETFKRNWPSTLKFDFICPICCKKAKRSGTNIKSYNFSDYQISMIMQFIKDKHKGIIEIRDSHEFRNDIVYLQTLRFKFYYKADGSHYYITLNQALNKTTKSLIKKLKSGIFSITDPKNNRYFNNYDKIIVPALTDRESQNKQSEVRLKTYQKNAKLLNYKLRNGEEVNSQIATNEESLGMYIHKSEKNAIRCLGIFDRKIEPFFAKNKDFKLITKREQYAYNKQYLLIRRIQCNHLFYSQWDWMNKKIVLQDGIQCQQKECFDLYYKTKYYNPNKIDNEVILAQFKKLFFGQYEPLDMTAEIKVREPISIVHIPTGKTINASFDNFRRGKFRCQYKKLNKEEIQALFPQYNFSDTDQS